MDRQNSRHLLSPDHTESFEIMPLFGAPKIAFLMNLGKKVFDAFEKSGVTFRYMAIGTPAGGFVAINFIIQNPDHRNWGKTYDFNAAGNTNRMYLEQLKKMSTIDLFVMCSSAKVVYMELKQSLETQKLLSDYVERCLQHLSELESVG